jgi:hypothetical protein
MSQNNLREIIKAEYKKCIENPIYFMKKYVKIQHPIRGTITFDLFDFQEDALRDLTVNDFNIILKSRQMGISTLVAAYSLWLMIFHSDKNIMCLSITQDTSKEIVTRVRFANDNLPAWLKVQCVEDNRLSLRLKNGSQIKASSSAGTAGRSAAVSLLVLDECAFIDDIEKIWLSSQYTLSTGGKAVLLSCVTKDTFVYTDSGIKQVNSFIPSNIVGDYVIDDYSVLGVDETRSSNLFKVNGNTNTLIVKTKYNSIEGSRIHKLWSYTSNDRKWGWVKLEDLTTNDYVSMQIGMNIWGNHDDLNFTPRVSNRQKNIFDINTITPEWSYLFGLYISEGSSYKVRNSNGNLVGGNITITIGDPEITWVFDKLKLNYSTSDNMHYTLSSKMLIELFEHVGFDLSNKAPQKHIPERLLEMGEENISSLLRGIFDGDGCSSGGTVSLTSTSELLINQVRTILINYGILSSTFEYDKDDLNAYECVKNKFNYNTHVLEIYGKYALKYFNLIGFNIERKKRNIEFLDKQRLTRNSSKNIIPNTLDLINLIYDRIDKNTADIKREHGIFINGIVNKKTKYKTDNISREIVITLYNTYKSYLTDDEILKWDRVIDDNIVWVKIDRITPHTNETYDFSLPNTDDHWCHSVIYNGFIGHQTPNGVGNFFHKMWVEAEAGENEFNTIRIPWDLHPERDQSWRDKQTALSGIKGSAQECDCSFATSGNQVVHIDLLDFQKETYVIDPIEKRGIDQELWIWERPDYSKNYVLTADCSRGDGADYSAFHIIDVDKVEQVAEYKGKMGTKDYGNLLVTVATEYNNALLIIDNINVGWASIQQVIDRGYTNMFYSQVDLKVIEPSKQFTNKLNRLDKKEVPGFTTTSRNRPLMISKMETYFQDKSFIMHSIRLYDELAVFIWKGTKPEAMKGYNDDLVMSLAMGLWVRDTALKLRNEQIEYNKHMLEGISKVSNLKPTTLAPSTAQDMDPNKTWKFKADGHVEDLTWLLK